MSTQVTEFKCPACTAPLRYAQDTGRLECDYCGSSYTVEEAEAFSEEKQKQAEEAFQKEAEAAKADAGQWDAPEAQGDWGADAAHLKTYHCPSCGAELICDEATAATSCPYCGNNTIIPGQFTGALKPDLVIPFKVGREEALSALRAHYKGKRLLPKRFSDENHIQEIKGVYVPFWLFDGQAEADVDFMATRSSVIVTGRERITTTRHFALRRGKVRCALMPVWLLSTQWEGKNFLFAMNGQTGKMVSDLPVSRKRYWTWWAGITAGISAAVALVGAVAAAL